MKPLAIDLCCGKGGWTLGLLAAGFRVIGYDIEDMGYVKSPDAQLVIQDIRTIDGTKLRGAQLIVASTPCQEFSVHGMKHFHPNPPHPTLGIELFQHAQRIAQEAGCPIVLENVRAARKFIGAAQAHIGSFYLWGDVPALLPVISGNKGFGDMGACLDGPEGSRRVLKPYMQFGSKSAKRKAWSAEIAMIPFALAKHVGECFL